MVIVINYYENHKSIKFIYQIGVLNDARVSMTSLVSIEILIILAEDPGQFAGCRAQSLRFPCFKAAEVQASNSISKSSVKVVAPPSRAKALSSSARLVHK